MRLLVRAYLSYRKATSELSVEYDECPIECPKNKARPINPNRNQYCDGCPLPNHQALFKRDVEAAWDKVFFDPKEFDFEMMLSNLYIIIGMEDRPDSDISVKSKTLLNMYLVEKGKFDR